MNEILDEITEKYSEYLEEEGVCSPSFVIEILCHQLKKEREEKTFYKNLWENKIRA